MPATKAPAAQPANQRAATSTNVPVGPLPVALPQRLGNQHLQALIRARRLQAKLAVSDPHDVYEQEADRVADQVMRAPETAPVASLTTTHVQRTCRECEDELHRSATRAGSAPTIDAATEQAIRSLSERGSPLPASVRASMEPRFGADFSGVRVHDDEQAHDLARSVNAEAFTVGRDVVFGAGHYAPHTAAGKRLLAHELTHVLQQSAAPGGLSRVQRQPAPVAPQHSEATANPSTIAFVRFRKGEAFLDLRAAPDAKSASLARLAFGRRLHTIDDQSPHPGWIKVVAAGKTGYVDATRIHFPPGHLIQQDPGLSLIRVRPNLSFYALVHEQYGIRGNESARDRNMNHFINAIRAVNKPDAFNVKTDFLDDIGNFALSGRDASDTYLKANFDLWIPSFGVAARMDVGSGTVRGEFTRFIRKIDETVADFVEACRLSGAYIPSAVSSRAGEVGAGLLAGLVDFALDAVKILAGSTATGALIGALFGGVGAIPGAEVGFEFGLFFLKYYGLYMLVEAIATIAVGVFEKLGEFVSLAWQANGDRKQLDLAARALADAIGLLVSAILIAVSIYVTKKGFDAIARTRFAAKVGASRLGRWLSDRREHTTAVRVASGNARAGREPPRRLPPGSEPQHPPSNTSPGSVASAAHPGAAPAATPPAQVPELRIGGFGRKPERVLDPLAAMQPTHPIPERQISGFARDPVWRTPPSDPPRLVVGGFAREPVRGTPHPQPATVEGFRGDPLKDVPQGDYVITFPTGVTSGAPSPTWLGPTRQPPPNVPTTGPQTSVPIEPAGAPAAAAPTPEVRVGGFGRPVERVVPDLEPPPVKVEGFKPTPTNDLLGEGIPPEGDFVMTVQVDPTTGQTKLSPPRMLPTKSDGPEAPRKQASGTGKNDDFDSEAPTPPGNPRREGKVRRRDDFDEEDTIVDRPRVPEGNDLPSQSGEIRAPDKSTDRPVTPEPKVIVDPEITDPRSSLSIPPEFKMVDEVIGDYYVRGSRALDGNVLRRRILMLQQRHGKAREGRAADAGRVSPSLRDVIRPINHFLELLLADAAAAGATRLEILGMAVQAASVRNIRLAVRRYGGTVTRISDTTINIDIPVTGP